MKDPLLDLHLSRGLGDTISATPSLRKLFYAYGKKISVLTEHTEIFKNNKYVDKIFDTSETSRESLQEKYELLVSFAPNLENEYEIGLRHNVMDIRQFHASGLGFTLLPEECEVDYSPDEWEPIENLPDKFVLIHPVQSWASRTWDIEKWTRLTEMLNDNGISVVSVGKSSSEIGFHMVQKPVFDFPIKLGLNLMNQTSISQTWWLIQKSLAFVTMDSGLLHLAGSTDAQIIQLGSSINWRLRAPFRNGRQDYKYHYIDGDCKIACASDMKYSVLEWNSVRAIPPLVGCLEKKSEYLCHPKISNVLNKLIEVIKYKKMKKLDITRTDLIKQIGKEFQNGKGVEVGTFKGEFSKEILNNWSGTLFMVDVWKGLPNEEYSDVSNHNNFEHGVFHHAMNNIQGFENRAIMIRASSEVSSNMFEDNSLDFVYIDANHAYDYVVQDIRLWYPKVKPGGYLCGHDYIMTIDWYNDPNFLNNKKDKHMYAGKSYIGIFGVNPAVDEFCEKNGYDLSITNEGHASWMIKKKDELVSETTLKLEKKVNPIRILFFAPHLSTGGMPSYLLKRIESLQQNKLNVEIFVAEFCQYSNIYTVQRNKIKELIPEGNFWTINTLNNHNVENSMKIMQIIKDNSIDIVHIDEMVEGFDPFNKVPSELINSIYDNNRTWRVVETCHNISFDPNTSKKFHPDAYALCTPYHLNGFFNNMPSHKEVFEFPIENKFRSREEQVKSQEILGLDTSKVHVINVGLWTSGKNQGEGIEIARHFQDRNVEFHFIGNQASNFKDYWEPLMSNLPSNVHIWGERSDVETFMKAADVLMFNSTWECNPLVIREAASFGLKIIARNLPQYVGMFNGLITPLSEEISTNVSLLRNLISSTRNYQILSGMTEDFAERHYNLYKFLLTQEPIKQIKNISKIDIKQFFINEPFLEIVGDSNSLYDVKFFDEQGVCHYHNKIKSNNWIKLNRRYFTKWNTKILEDGVLVYDKTLDYKGKRVLINFESSSLGDTIAWIPYALEFKKVHECDVIVSTHLNYLFRDTYTEIEFVEPGNVVHDIQGQYNLGWFYDTNKEPVLPNTIPLQQAATNILGLPYTEIKPRISYKIYDRPYEEKYVTIATNSTAGCKFWTKEGWQELINYLHSLGYKVINVSKEDNHFNNCEKVKNVEMDYTMNVIHHSEFFIGLSSGLSWLSWALGKHVVMISNFTNENHEFSSNCTRITNLNVCNSCWNNPSYKFNRGDWYWCPVHKGTSRQFECHTSITSEMVISGIQNLLKPKLFQSKKPKIQIKHLLTRIEDEREKLSIESISKLKEYGFDYFPIINKVYEGFPPSENCRRPEHLSKDNKPGELFPGAGLGWITGRHYGCYLAHRETLETIDNGYDYTLIFEADAYICTSVEEFVDIIFKSCEIMEKDDVYFLSFSNNLSRHKEKIDNYFSKTASNQDLAHAYIIRNKDKEWWMQRLIDCGWDSADLWYNHVFENHPKLRYTTNKSYSNQGAGYSLLDEVEKK
jgi:autotransporter strand-loop-strand O-heptosyltransferase